MKRPTSRPALRLSGIAGAALAALLLPVAAPSAASTFGSLANFDVVNDTTKPAYGFEIELEDLRYDHAGTISNVFGYDRVFSFVSPDPGAVVRFGKPTIEYIAGFGARIHYGRKAGEVINPLDKYTPSAPFTTNGESCWPGANPNWQLSSCDHYGVSTYGAPAKTTYSWLVDKGSGTLGKAVVGVPVVNFVFTPAPPPPVGAPPAVPAVVRAVVAAPPPILPAPQDNAYWVKMVKTTVGDNVDLNDLLGGNHPGALPEIAALRKAPEVETEWHELQIGRVDEVTKEVNLLGNPSAVWNFQFYKYQGQFDGENLVDPLPAQMPKIDANGVAYVVLDDGRHDLTFVGQQIAAFNANELAAVPEPQTWALMLAGVAAIGMRIRRQRRG